MEAYRRSLETAQNALERRDQATDELEDALDEDTEREKEGEPPREPPGKAIELANVAPVAHLAVSSLPKVEPQESFLQLAPSVTLSGLH
jgi:hypothetical protein